MEIKLKVAKPSLTKFQIYFIIGIAILVLVNAVSLYVYLLPELENLKQVKQVLVQKKLTLQSVRNEYSDEKISEKEIEELTNRVPVRRTDSDNLIFFQDLALLSMAPLAYVKQSNEDENTPQTSETAVPNSNTITNNLEVVVVGHLPSLLLYIDNMQKHERLFTLQKWNLTELTKETVNKDYPDLNSHPFIKKDKPILSLRMNIQTYIFPQYADVFRKVSDTEKTQEQSA
ncbi:hypothetical protein BK120_07200 [Paenibacillus sp. FSL A5-0031]|uniref:hypothetical protein n=1 Tax=Paenibacillus sp. FSL A5-0031 TaxID=1920420 RepID=UPI00096F4707|nr:hypothetical protein [Paenibacillus sp. FSL A5-0031]OME86715.1 hypothetical protein BK120_07200 [Paenibacillus sp. FSL A5-0031]